MAVIRRYKLSLFYRYKNLNLFLGGREMSLIRIYSALAFLFSIAMYVPYVKSVLSSKAHPTISSWISWCIMDAAILGAMIAQDAIASQMVAYVMGTVVVVAASLLKGAVLGWKKLDSICLVIVVAAVALWILSGNPDVAIMLSLMAIIIGTVPMIVNILYEPTHEPFLPWVLCLIGGFFGVAAIPAWTIAAALTPVVFLVLQVMIVVLVSRKFRSPEIPA